MKLFYVNDKAQTNGDYEVHEDGCPYMPHHQHRSFLGQFPNCKLAVAEAEKKYRQVNGCKTCARECNTQ